MSRAWVVAERGIIVVDSAAPPPEEQDVVIAVEAAHLPWAHLSPSAEVPGWAAVGRVVAAGERALALLDQRVLVGAIDPCGQCETCRRGGGTVCPLARRRGDGNRGTLAERITVAARWVVPLAELGLDASEARAGADGSANGDADPDADRDADRGALPPLHDSGELASDAPEDALDEAHAPALGELPRDPGDGSSSHVTDATAPRPTRLGAAGALAVLAGEAALAYTAYARSDLAPKEPVVVLGRTPVTRFLVEILLAKGITPVVVVQPPTTPRGPHASDAQPSAQDGDDATFFAWTAWLAARGAGVATVTGVTMPSPGEQALAAARSAIALVLARAAPASASPSPDATALSGRPWRIVATDPASLSLAAALAGPRATITAVCAAAQGQVAGDGGFGAALWQREVSVIGVAAASPELILETAALAARGQLDLQAGVVVREVGSLGQSRQLAQDPTCALVLTLPA